MRRELGVPVSLAPDPVVEAYKKGVDVTLLDENLRLTVPERVAKLAAFVDFLDRVREGGERTREREVREAAARAR